MLHASEIADLRFWQLDLKRQTIALPEARTSSVRRVQLTREASDTLSALLRHRRTWKSKVDPVFVQIDGKALKPKKININRIRKIVAGVGRRNSFSCPLDLRQLRLAGISHTAQMWSGKAKGYTLCDLVEQARSKSITIEEKFRTAMPRPR